MREACARRTRGGMTLAAALAGSIGAPACDKLLGSDALHVVTCDRGINEFGCVGDCSPGARRCAGITPQTCDTRGEWQSSAPCDRDMICSGGVCVVDCRPGDLRCSGDASQLCDLQGKWVMHGDMPCSPSHGCDPFTGDCSESPRPATDCPPGTRRCAGTTPQSCNADGEWEDQPLCSPGTHCAGGACVVTCTPGDLHCSGDQPEKCNAVGEWEVDGPACEPCVGCDSSTARCAFELKPDGAVCTDPDRCTLTAECQAGTCVPRSRVECVNAGVCSPGACDPSTGSCAAPDGMACDDDDVCTPSDSSCQAGICTSTPRSDRAWANRDLASSPPSPRYTYTDHVVFDNMTGLTWQRRVPAGTYSWADAKSFCGCLNDTSDAAVRCDLEKIPGYPSGWRLPTRIELVSIVDHAFYVPIIDGAAFPDTPPHVFWSSSPAAHDSRYAWLVQFSFGNVLFGSVGDTYRVRCVR
jgi:Protein of unknown function (DUF1566)